MKNWQKWTAQPLFLPFYHVVSDQPLPHIRPLYEVRSVKKFRADLDFLLQNFQPIGLDDVWRSVFDSNFSFKKPIFHLSFDDGLRECHDVILPILLEKGVPATFFLNPDFLENQGLMFRYKAALLLENDCQTPFSPLAVRYADRLILDEWATTANLDFEDFLKKQQPYLTIEQAKTLQNDGFSLAAHSLDHPIFNQISPDEQLRQAIDSWLILKKMFNLTQPAFAFPFTDDGVPHSFFEKIEAALGQPMLTFGTAGLKLDSVESHLQRFPMEAQKGSARQAISAEFAYFLLKKAVGRHTIRRADR